MLFDFMTFEEFVKWYTELGKLKIFWAKPVENIRLLSKEDGLYLVGVKWIIRSRIKEAILAIAEMVDKVPKAIDSLKNLRLLNQDLNGFRRDTHKFKSNGCQVSSILLGRKCEDSRAQQRREDENILQMERKRC
jgi:hypothetical protein